MLYVVCYVFYINLKIKFNVKTFKKYDETLSFYLQISSCKFRSETSFFMIKYVPMKV